VTDDVASVAVWASPDQRTGRDEGLAAIRSAIATAQGSRADYARRSCVLWESFHPAEPHWYLQTLGTHPDSQRRGLGRAVCAAALEWIDAAAAPAFVDTSTAANVPLYESLGFAVVGEWDMPDGGPHGWAMWRTAR
jgi:ribosomal protein S18 acetylase RimI-like enzyme